LASTKSAAFHKNGEFCHIGTKPHVGYVWNVTLRMPYCEIQASDTTMKNRLISLLLLTLLIESCAPLTASPTQPPTATATKTVAPSRTPPPTQTAVPSATPYPPLQTDGPYLLYSTNWRNLTILDSDGKGRKQFQLPNEGFVRDLRKAVSPDGKWLVYFTGSSHEEPYDLALHLLNIQDQTTTLVADLIKPGFPENLEPVKTSDPLLLENCSSGSCRISLIELAFNEGIESLAWSPDSQALAFAAQIDGPSSDVYLYEIQEQAFHRLAYDLENVRQIDWSPNGKRILYQNSTAGVTYTPTYIYVADPNNRATQSPKSIYGGLFWNQHGWIAENLFLVSKGGEGAPPQNIQYINTDTQQVTEIWPDEAQYVSTDQVNHQIILARSEFERPEVQGIYILSRDGSYKKISEGFYYLFEKQEFPGLYFGLDGLTNETYQLIGIRPDGSVISFSRKVSYGAPPQISLDKKWIASSNDKGTEIYDANLNLISTIGSYSEKIIWTPDSMGVFLINSNTSYYLPISSREPISINLCDDCYPFDYTWLP
jgi:hypothetical protein